MDGIRDKQASTRTDGVGKVTSPQQLRPGHYPPTKTTTLPTRNAYYYKELPLFGCLRKSFEVNPFLQKQVVSHGLALQFLPQNFSKKYVHLCEGVHRTHEAQLVVHLLPTHSTTLRTTKVQRNASAKKARVLKRLGKFSWLFENIYFWHRNVE